MINSRKTNRRQVRIVAGSAETDTLSLEEASANVVDAHVCGSYGDGACVGSLRIETMVSNPLGGSAHR